MGKSVEISNKAIGGYFELELPHSTQVKYQDAIKYQSARAAFLALLRFKKPSRVWMPHYICESMLVPLHALNIEICFYSLDANLGIADEIMLDSNDLLLYVNYFGVCAKQVEIVLNKFDHSQVVLDFSQAFFSEPQNCLATIYSIRKFFGVPDGGLLLTKLPIHPPPAVIDGSSIKRMDHLMVRLDQSPEAGYAAYQMAEASLNELEPMQMSHLTERIFQSIDFNVARIQRNKNFQHLHELLGPSNKIKIDICDIDGPMSYPYLCDGLNVKSILMKKRVFIPTYWPDVLARDNVPETDSYFVDAIHPLPCDHRYTAGDMDNICNWLLSS